MEYADGDWTEVARISYAVEGDGLELAVPAELLKLSGSSFGFDFKWADNPGELVDPISLCTHGDSAPNRRFNYRFIWKK